MPPPEIAGKLGDDRVARLNGGVVALLVEQDGGAHEHERAAHLPAQRHALHAGLLGAGKGRLIHKETNAGQEAALIERIAAVYGGQHVQRLIALALLGKDHRFADCGMAIAAIESVLAAGRMHEKEEGDQWNDAHGLNCSGFVGGRSSRCRTCV
ncbi:MAG: hypothetical protein IPM46_05655 [Flavobacteriales bacterium]|nr:hypothetical protein [Flavobacteriales bacterium]